MTRRGLLYGLFPVLRIESNSEENVPVLKGGKAGISCLEGKVMYETQPFNEKLPTSINAPHRHRLTFL